MRKASICKASLGWMTLLGAILISNSSWAQSPSNTPSNTQFATEVVRKAKKPKPEKGNGETVPERERRLLRECKGRPNAGACAGFAS